MAKAASHKSAQHKKTAASQAAFLAAYAENGTIRHAATAAGIGRRTHYDWLDSDPDYVDAFDDAQQEAGEALEIEARRRATEGVEVPVYFRDKKIGTIRKFSDVLLIFLLNGIFPEKYRARNSTELTGRNGRDLIPISDEDRAEGIYQILSQESARTGNPKFEAMAERIRKKLKS